MSVSLPILSFVLIFLCCQKLRSSVGEGLRPAFLAAALIWAALAVISIELLSSLSQITPLSLTLFWALVSAGSGVLFIKTKPSVRTSFAHWSAFELLLGVCLSVTLLLTAVTAWMSAPNTWDSMTYHMSRVAHWQQNHSVDFYPTSILRQLVYPPAAEYLILHFQILSHSDRWANLIQWFAFLGCLSGVSAIAAHWNADGKTQLLTALLTAAIPMAILESSGTQNDLVVSFWLVSLVYWGMVWTKDARGIPAVLTGLALGLSVLTKGTGLLFAVIPFLWLAVSALLRHKFKAVGQILVILLTAALLNLPFALRLQEWKSLSPGLNRTEFNLTVSGLDPFLAAANLLRNVGMHLVTPFPTANEKIQQKIYSVAERLHIPLNDPRVSFGDYEFYLSAHPFHEDNAGNPLHMILILTALALLVILFRRLPKGTGGLGICVLLNTIAFCLLLKWQPWHGRLHLPLFILAMPVVGVVLARIHRHSLTLIGLIAFFCSLPWLLFNESRPLAGERSIFTTPRRVQSFANNPGFEHSYHSAVQTLAGEGCTQAGLTLNGDGWEYPLWPLFQTYAGKDFRLEHLFVDNESARFAPLVLDDFNPCAIIDDGQKTSLALSFKGQTYVRTREWAFLNLYRRDDSGTLYRQAFMFYFNRMISLAASAARTAHPQELALLREQELKTARLFNVEELNTRHPSLGGQLTMYKEGLAEWLEAYADQDQTALTAAHKKIIEWYRWLVENQAGLRDSFKF